jgi:hypothetical protein
LHRDLAIAGEELRARIAPERLMEWAEEKTVLPGPSCRILAAVLSVGAAAGIAEYVEGGSKWPLLAVLAIEGLLLTWLGKKAKEAIAKIDCNAEGLQLFAEVLERFEKVTFASARLQSISRELVEAQGVTGIEKSDSTRSSVAVRRLARVVYWVDAQDNFILKLAKLPFLYTLQVALAAEAWKRRFGGRLRRWMEIGGEMEALVSLGTYAYEHPHDVFPEFVGPGGEALFDGEALGHPLIAEAQCVRNSVRLDARTRVLLVSGSNMSGKSTLLRTVGINAVLAMAGAPVRAARLHMTPLEIGTRIRSGDSLQEGRSNFYTEILHLRQVFDLLGTKGGQLELVELPRRGADGIDDERPRRPAPESLDPPSARLLFLFDELLDGTNSHDRRIAAERLLRTLVEGGAIGMVTTHDLALTEMGALLQDQLRNVHFEDQVAEGKMRFDYRLRDGVLTKSNAIELMRIIGLDV